MCDKYHGCHNCGEEKIPRIVAGKLTCPECGSENIVCIQEDEPEQLEGFDCRAGFAGTAQPLTCANCGEVSTNPGQFTRDGRWICTKACRDELCEKQSYDDLAASGGIVDAP